MEKEHIHGQMVVYMKENSKMTRKKDMEHYSTQMEKSMKEIGEMAGSMAKEN